MAVTFPAGFELSGRSYFRPGGQYVQPMFGIADDVPETAWFRKEDEHGFVHADLINSNHRYLCDWDVTYVCIKDGGVIYVEEFDGYPSCP